MQEQINLNKQFFNKNAYEKVINTSFTQLVSANTSSLPVTQSISVEQFFQYYNELFYEIPKLGDTLSHSYLIAQSSAYVGVVSQSAADQALINEITSLLQQNLQLQEQNAQLQVSASLPQ